MILCKEPVCVGTPIQQLVIERALAALPVEVHLFSSGAIELDYTLADGWEDTPHCAHVFACISDALAWVKDNASRLVVDTRIRWIDGSAGMFTEAQWNDGSYCSVR